MAKTTKAKFKLGDRPESFPPIKVQFKTNRGADAEIEVVFKYRTREEFGANVGEHFYGRTEDFPRTDDGQIDYRALTNKTTGNEATYMASMLEKWDLEDELSVENFTQLANEQPGAIGAIKAAYAAACSEGRLGN